MINDNKEDFMNAVSIKAEEYRSKSFEACLGGFMKSVMKESLTLDIPKQADVETKTKIADEVKSTINTAAKEIANNAVNNDYDKSFNVDIAKEIVNPKNFCESVQQVLAEHIFNESEDRARLLNTQFEAGRFKDSNSEEVFNYVNNVFANEAFDTRFDNGKELQRNLHLLLSTEGETVVDDIASEVNELVNQTEAKNSIIREAVSKVNETKANIERKINGESDEEKESDKNDKSDDSSNDSDDLNMDDEIPSMENYKSTEGFYNKAYSNKKYYSTEDLYQIYTAGGSSKEMSSEEFNIGFDKDSFSREQADTILKAFQELDGVDTDSIEDNPETLSTSDDNEQPSTDEISEGEASAEHDYEDDPDRYEMTTEVEDIEPEGLKGDLSEESIAKDFIPLNFNKVANQTININSKLPTYLAFTKDNGQAFFDGINYRNLEMRNLLSKEDAIVDNVAKDDVEHNLDNTIEKCNKVHEDVNVLTENLGILGILNGDYQRTDNMVQNAVNSLFKPEIIKPMGKELSKEELYENNLAEIFKLAIKISDVKSEIANGVDIIGNKDELGYLNELLNEKVFTIEPGDKLEVESKITALQSIESMVGIDEIANMQVFVFNKEDKPESEKVKLNSIKNIDAYGFSYVDEIENIKKEVKKNYNDHMKNANVSYNFDIDALVEAVVEEQDTTKLTSNLYEKIISKLVENRDITNSTEGLVIKNKAKVITTSYVAGSKLGFLNSNDVTDIRVHLES